MHHQEETGFFQSKKDDFPLFYRSYQINQAAEKNVIFVHGALEHSGRYNNLVMNLNEKGINCFGFDLRGHGKSKQKDAQAFPIFLDDLDSFIHFLEQKYKILKPIIIGHSLGGLIVLNYCLKEENRKKLLAAYVSAPALSVNLTPMMKIKEALGKYCLIKIAPKMKLPVGLDLKYLTHDEEEVKKYKEDPLVSKKLSISLALSILEEGKNTIKEASRIKDFPLFLAHGDEDRISYNEGTKNFYKNLNTKNKFLTIYPNCYHELFNEKEELQKIIFKDLINFISTL
jgi:alpha-beta hydrolase superfamily lysophospholipase